MNATARLVLEIRPRRATTRHDSVEVGTLIYRCPYNTAPSYVIELLQLVTDDDDDGQRLRSVDWLPQVAPASRRSTIVTARFQPVEAVRARNARSATCRQSCSVRRPGQAEA